MKYICYLDGYHSDELRSYIHFLQKADCSVGLSLSFSLRHPVQTLHMAFMVLTSSGYPCSSLVDNNLWTSLATSWTISKTSQESHRAASLLLLSLFSLWMIHVTSYLILDLSQQSHFQLSSKRCTEIHVIQLTQLQICMCMCKCWSQITWMWHKQSIITNLVQDVTTELHVSCMRSKPCLLAAPSTLRTHGLHLHFPAKLTDTHLKSAKMADSKNILWARFSILNWWNHKILCLKWADLTKIHRKIFVRECPWTP